MNIKGCLKNLVLNIISFLLRVFRRFSNNNYRCIAVPAGPGSVGDDAMVRVLVRHTLEDGYLPLLIGGKEAHAWNYIGQVKDIISLNSNSLLELLKFMVCIIKTDRLYIIGADIMDGHYDEDTILRRLEMSKLFSKSNVEVRVTGFSFNRAPKKKVVESLNENNSNHYFLRDSFSLERFKEATYELNSYLSANLAFLIEQTELPSEDVSKVFSWVNERKGQGDKVVVVNINWFPFKSLDKSPSDVIERYKNILLELYNQSDKKLSFLIVPHDFRNLDNKGDIALGEKVFNTLSNTLKNNIRFINFKFNSQEVSYFISKADFTITGRMHLAIIASTNNIASFSFAYQDKFQGFYQMLGLDSNNLMTDEPIEIFDALTIQNITRAISNSSILSETIKNNRDKIIELSMINFKSI